MVDQEQFLTIQEVAYTYHVTYRTLRFYESAGLLSPRRAGHLRIYSSKDVVRLELILKGKRLGFSLREIARLIADRAPDVLSALTNEDLIKKIGELTQERVELQGAIDELNGALSGEGTIR